MQPRERLGQRYRETMPSSRWRQAGRAFNPVGYRIGLEFIVKCDCERVVEVQIHFEDRQLGKSKLTVRQQLLYLKHLRRLYTSKFGAWSQFVQFLTVGGLATVVNLVLLTTILRLGASPKPAVATAMCFNFVLNRGSVLGNPERIVGSERV